MLVIGDSHASVFNSWRLRSRIQLRYKLSVCSVGGATVSGLDNPNSQTQAVPAFKKAYQDVNPDVVIILLGEVDAGFVIWFRAQKYGESVSAMLEKATSNYETLLLSIRGKLKTIVISAPLPTIGDEDSKPIGDVANARREVKASQLERTKLTVSLNRKVESFSREHGVDYLNLDRQTLGENGIVDPLFLNKTLSDHHYDNSAYSRLIAKNLFAVIR